MEAPRKRAVIYDIASDLSKAYAVIFSPKPYGFDSLTATVKEVTDGALLMEKDGGAEAINLDFVLRIREHPTNKKGKKKSVVLD